MPQKILKVLGWKCARCGYEWIAKKKGKPNICPKCKSKYWDLRIK